MYTGGGILPPRHFIENGRKQDDRSSKFRAPPSRSPWAGKHWQSRRSSHEKSSPQLDWSKLRTHQCSRPVHSPRRNLSSRPPRGSQSPNCPRQRPYVPQQRNEVVPNYWHERKKLLEEQQSGDLKCHLGPENNSIPDLTVLKEKMCEGLKKLVSGMISGNVLERARPRDNVELVEITIDTLDDIVFQHPTEKDYAKHILRTERGSLYYPTSRTVKDFPLCDFILFTPDYENHRWEIVIIELKCNLQSYIDGNHFTRVGKLTTDLGKLSCSEQKQMKKRLENLFQRQESLKSWIRDFSTQLGDRFTIHSEIILLEKKPNVYGGWSSWAFKYNILLQIDGNNNIVFRNKQVSREPEKIEIQCN